MRVKFCRSKGCKSEGERKQVLARGMCGSCYMKAWRRQQKGEPIQDGEDELIAFVSRQQHTLRRETVRRLMDAGTSFTSMVQAFATDPALMVYMEGVSAKLVLLRRDWRHWQSKDKGRPLPVLNLEKVIRTLERLSADPKTPPSVSFKAAKELEAAYDKHARLLGQVVGVPGVGSHLVDDEDDLDDSDPWAKFDEMKRREGWADDEA